MFGPKIISQKVIFRLTLIAVALLGLPVASFAVSVGPLDGSAGPALPPIATPATSLMVEELADTGFPKSLEELGDLPSAALEWQRIAHKSSGHEREQALTNATRLHIAMGQPIVASALITELLTENPATPYAPEALYHIASGPGSSAQIKAREQLQKTFPENPWTTAALLHDVWTQAETNGKISQTYNLPQARELQKRIAASHALRQQKIAKAGALGVLVPGAGHAFAGNIPQGLTVFMVWCLFTLAFLSACRHRHYAYSFIFVVPAVALWLTSPTVAMQIVREHSRKTLEASLAQWTDLRPVLPTDKPTTTP